MYASLIRTALTVLHEKFDSYSFKPDYILNM